MTLMVSKQSGTNGVATARGLARVYGALATCVASTRSLAAFRFHFHKDRR